jgi:hypothetical protein
MLSESPEHSLGANESLLQEQIARHFIPQPSSQAASPVRA